jgi:hypothetical protein
MSHVFSWVHESNGNKSTIQIPMKVTKCTDSGNGVPTGTLICNDCETQLVQKYICPSDGKSFTIKEITKRRDKDNDITYDFQEKKAFLSSASENKIDVIGEISLLGIVKNIESIEGFYEIYNNDNTTVTGTISKIHAWLSKHDKALIATFGYRGGDFCGAIIPTDKKLLLLQFRDHRNIRPPKQQGITELTNEEKEIFEVFTEDPTPDLYEKFVEKIKKGEKISIEVAKKTEPKLEVSSISFLEE